MSVGSSRVTVCIGVCLLVVVRTARTEADDGPAQTKTDPTPRRNAVVTGAAAGSSDLKRQPITAGAAPTLPEPSEAKAEVEARLKELGEKDLTPVQKVLKALWEERLQRLKEWDEVRKARQAVENPKPTPEELAAKKKDELARARAYVAEMNKSPDILLSDVFRLGPDQVTEVKLGEMRDAIENMKQGVIDRAEATSKLDLLAKKSDRSKQLRIERDKLHAKLTTYPALRSEREAGVATAKDEDARRVARERLMNFHWENGIEAERLLWTEAELAMEARLSGLNEIDLQTSETVLGVMKAREKALTDRYKVVSEQYQAALHKKAAVEERLAAESDDPVEKYKARGRAEQHHLEAEIADDEKTLMSSPDISLEEQTGLANRAEQDFGNLKTAVQQDRMGGLLALRLNNDFRRISRERALLLGKELPKANAATTAYENQLTEVELSYFGDDRFERDAFIESLPPGRQAAAAAAVDKLDLDHKALLKKRRGLLDSLLKRAEETHIQVDRRLRILDEHYAFIRTNIFWVRDSEPIGPESVGLIRGDAKRVAKAMLRLAAEPFDRSRWSPISVEFGVGVFGMITLPWAILSIRRALKGMMA